MTHSACGDPLDHLDVAGLQIGYRRAGEGPPLVLLHGGPTHSGEFRQQLEGLSDQLMVIAWDMPGCGQSSDPPEHFQIRDYVSCLAGFIAALGLEKTHVLGLSFGTGLALELYRAHPQLVHSLILVSAYAGWAGSLPPEIAAQRKQRMQGMIELPPEAWAREWLPTLLSESAPPDVAEELRVILADFHPVGQRTLVESGFAEHDLRDLLPRINVPTLLLYGQNDVRSPLNVAETMHASIPASELVIVPGIGHMVDMEAPSQMNAEVRRFLHSLPG